MVTEANTSNHSMDSLGYFVRPGCVAAYGTISILGTILNTVTIVIIVYGKSFGKSIKPQLLSLAIADLLSAITCPAAIVPTGCMLVQYPDNPVLCKLNYFGSFYFFYVSLLSNAAVGLERFVAVFFPFKMRHFRKKHATIIIILTWVVGGIAHVDALIYQDVVEKEDGRRNCVTAASGNSDLVSLLTGIRFAVPAFTIVIVYSFISVRLLLRRPIGDKNSHSNPPTNPRILVMLGVDAVFSLITWGPYVVLLLKNRELYSSRYWTSSPVPLICVLIAMGNCFTTPIIYIIFNKDFWEDGKNLVSVITKKQAKDVQPKSSNIANTRIAGSSGHKKNTFHGTTTISLIELPQYLS